MKRYIDVITGRKCALSALASLLFAFTAQADWTLTSGNVGNTTMTDGTATLKVKVLDATARTLRLGQKDMTATSFAKDYPVTSKDNAWELDFSKPITLAGSDDTWTIVEVCPWAFCNTKNIYAPATGLDLTSVTNIGAGAFMYCQGFTKILLSTKLEEVGHSAFNQCFKNAQFVPQLPPSLKKIGHGAFAHHTKYDGGNIMALSGTLELLGLEEIHGCAFNWLPGITEVRVGSKLATVDAVGATVDNSIHNGFSPFCGLNKLQTITFYGPAPTSLPANFLDDRYRYHSGNGNAWSTDSSSTRTVTCYLYEDYTNGWVTAMAATGGTIADYTDANNAKVFAKWTGGNGNRTIHLALLDGHPASETEPQFTAAPTLVKSGSSFLFTGRLSEGEGALSAVFTATDGTEYLFPLTSGNEVTGDANETAYTLAFDLSSGATGLPQNQTYSFAIRGTNSHSETVTQAGDGTFFFGEVDVSVSTASVSENGGSLTYTVSRTGTDGALTVPLMFSGTAAEFANYREVPHSVTIADGTSSASITVDAVVALDAADTTLTVAADTTALLFADDTATATIADWDEPLLADFPSSLEFTAVGCSLAQSAALANFPILVRLPAEQVSQIGSSAGLAFFQNGTLLPHEVDTWSAEDGALVWVGMDELYTNAVVTCAWGNTGYTAPNLAYDLWREAGYIGVWHLGETGDGEVSLANSTVVGAAFDGSSSATTAANASGAVGAGRTVSATQTNTGRLTMPMPDDYLDVAWRFTASFWVNQFEAGTNRAEYVAGSKPTDDPGGWYLRREAITTTENYYSKGLNSSEPKEVKPSFSTPITDEWKLLSVSFDNAANPTYQMSRNGEMNPFDGHIYASTDTPFTFGNVTQSGQNGLTGAMDEIRIRRTMSTADWLAAEYATVSDPEFLTCPQSSAVRGAMLLVW